MSNGEQIDLIEMTRRYENLKKEMEYSHQKIKDWQTYLKTTSDMTRDELADTFRRGFLHESNCNRLRRSWSECDRDEQKAWQGVAEIALCALRANAKGPLIAGLQSALRDLVSASEHAFDEHVDGHGEQSQDLQMAIAKASLMLSCD